jgi:hypothetical protein
VRILASRHPGALLFLLPPACLVGLSLAAVVLGRMNLRDGPGVLASNSYYAYTPFLLLCVGLYYLWVRFPFAPAVVVRILVAALVILSCASAVRVHAMTARIQDDFRPVRRQIDCMQALIDRHRHEPGFAISFDPEVFHSLEHFHGLSLLEILFCRHIDHQSPSHVIAREEGKWRVLTATEYASRYGGPRHRQLPAFVRPAVDYMVYSHGSRYYGMYHWDGRFRTDRRDYRHLIEGDSAAEVLAQVPAALRQIEAEVHSGRR